MSKKNLYSLLIVGTIITISLTKALTNIKGTNNLKTKDGNNQKYFIKEKINDHLDIVVSHFYPITNKCKIYLGQITMKVKKLLNNSQVIQILESGIIKILKYTNG